MKWQVNHCLGNSKGNSSERKIVTCKEGCQSRCLQVTFIRGSHNVFLNEKEFEEYKEAKKKLKVFRLEAVRAGFRKAW